MAKIKAFALALHRNCIPQAAVLLALFAVLASSVQAAYGFELSDAAVRIEDGGNRVRIVASGLNLLRVNSIYINEACIKDAQVNSVSYELCNAAVDRSVFGEDGWYRIEFGRSKWDFLNIKSNPVWVEWVSDGEKAGND